MGIVVCRRRRVILSVRAKNGWLEEKKQNRFFFSNLDSKNKSRAECRRLHIVTRCFVKPILGRTLEITKSYSSYLLTRRFPVKL